MNYCKLCISITIVLIISLLTVSYAQASKEPPIKIGFVNIKTVFQDYQKIKQIEDKTKQEAEAEYVKIKELKEQSKQLQDEIPLYRPGSKIRLRKEKELTEKAFEIKYKEEKANHFFSQKLKTAMEQVYQEMIEEIEEYAKQNNFFLILRIADADFFGATNPEGLKMQIHTRDVLYWGKDYDITQIIISRMNEKYKNQVKSFKGKEEEGGEKK